MTESISPAAKTAPYRVLARKYRPQNFDELIGQEALVRTLKNAIDTGRVAHAFMLTGVRGVGKTTTARIIAKALNYVGPAGTSGPTSGPTDDCPLCRAIAEDRHPDVIEMDAATRTGVDDMREILDGVRYAPSEARYKIYIIDEVHMLSKNAFNALLKTLEEPPSHVKFIFATTEIRKVPVTVLSRCQRFDLRRVDMPTLTTHYAEICARENVSAEPEALNLIARAADGSVRDGLSMLDQAIALGNADAITADHVREMLGLADRGRALDLLCACLEGQSAHAMALLDDSYKRGGDPLALLHDLMELTHGLARLRALGPHAELQSLLAGPELERARTLAADIGMPAIGKTWQLLVKGLSEVQIAPNPQKALEMLALRLCYAAELPDPADLLRRLQGSESASTAPALSGAPSGAHGTIMQDGAGAEAHTTAHNAAPALSVLKGGQALAMAPPSPQAHAAPHVQNAPLPEMPQNLPAVIKMLENAGALVLAQYVFQCVHLLRLEQGRLEIALTPDAPARLAQDLMQELSRASGKRWVVSVSNSGGQPTLAQQRQAELRADLAQALESPNVAAVINLFPGAQIEDILPPEEMPKS